MLEIKLDTEEVEKALSETTLNHKQIMRKTLSAIGKNQAKEFNRMIGASTTSRSGELRKSYKYKVRVDNYTEKVTMFARGQNGTKSIYPKLMSLNFGATIKPLKYKVLTFVGSDGQWHRSYGVNIVARNFLETAWGNYAGSGRYLDDVQEMIEKELQKYWG